MRRIICSEGGLNELGVELPRGVKWCNSEGSLFRGNKSSLEITAGLPKGVK